MPNTPRLRLSRFVLVSVLDGKLTEPLQMMTLELVTMLPTLSFCTNHSMWQLT